MEQVDHHGRSTAFRRVDANAEGPTVLYVHGSGASHRVWVNQYAPDGPAHPACALDLSGHGDSEDFDGGRDQTDSILDAYARDVAAVATAVGADVLVGNSLGGAIVLTVALGDRIDPDAIVLTGTGARLHVGEKLRTLLAEDLDAAIELLHGEDVLFHDAEEETVERSKAVMRAAGGDVLRRDFEACHTFDVRDRLGEIDVPALALAGEHDRLTPPAKHRELAETMADCRCRRLDGTAHLAMLERPDAFNAAIEAFLVELC